MRSLVRPLAAAVVAVPLLAGATDWFPALADLPADMEGHDAVLDGEVVIRDRVGRPSTSCAIGSAGGQERG